jgi:hypothetical protein
LISSRLLVPLDEVFFVLEADMEPKLNENKPVNSCVIVTTPTKTISLRSATSIHRQFSG